MELKRYFEPEALAGWQAGLNQFISSNMAAAIKKNDEEVSRGAAQRKNEADLRQELRDQYVGANGLPAISHVNVTRMTPDGTWNLSTKLKEEGEAAGWLSTANGVVTIKTGDDRDDVSFAIVRRPGYYCVHCGVKLDSERHAKQHVRGQHATDELPKFTDAGKLPPDYTPDMKDKINNPAGYQRINHFELKLV